jgi:diacylglycerol kinase family enzyme
MMLIENGTTPELSGHAQPVSHHRVVVLVNRGAGTIDGQGIDSFRATLAAGFEQRGIAAEIEFLEGARIQKAAEDAVAARHRMDAVIVGGGDGTIRAVAGVLADTGIPLGILPLGTMNHFAKDAGIPVDIDGALDVIAARCVRSVDAGEVNGRIFINNSSIGVYPSLVLHRERTRRSDGHSKWLATALAIFRILQQFPIHRLSIFANGAQQPVRTPCLFVGNNHYGLTPLTLGQRHSLEAGELCLYVAKQQSRIGLLWLAVRSSFGLIDRTRDLRTLNVAAAEIRSRKSRLFVAMDGEVELMRPPLNYRSRSGALHVLGPPATKP